MFLIPDTATLRALDSDRRRSQLPALLTAAALLAAWLACARTSSRSSPSLRKTHRRPARDARAAAGGVPGS